MIETPPTPRRGRRVALLGRYPQRDPAMPQSISNHGLRMVQAALLDGNIDGLDLRTYDLAAEVPREPIIHDLLRYDPDIIGFSTYLWSFPFFVDLARTLKQDDPSRVVVLGGPSARPSMMRLPPFRQARSFVDALVINEGERTFVEIVKLADRGPSALSQVAGVAVPDGGPDGEGWFESVARPSAPLDELASPYERGLVPRGGLGVLQTYRGCPFTCSFCEWGILESPKRVRSTDSLSREFSAMDANRNHGALLVDAGLNLNQNAFRNLREATERTGFFERRQLICEVYPAKIRDEHIQFLRSVGRPLVGVGLQSFDNGVLAHVERSYDDKSFDEQLARLTDVSAVAVEIILGLPGDSPENFRKSFERARSLPCALRVYHCVVLPSALMVRAPAHYQMRYDPVSLKMRSCLGWPETDLLREVEFLKQQAIQEGGQTGEFFWIFPPALSPSFV